MLSDLHSSLDSSVEVEVDSSSFSAFTVVVDEGGNSNFSTTTSLPEAVAKLSSSGASAAFFIGRSIRDLRRASTCCVESVKRTAQIAMSWSFEVIFD